MRHTLKTLLTITLCVSTASFASGTTENLQNSLSYSEKSGPLTLERENQITEKRGRELEGEGYLEVQDTFSLNLFNIEEISKEPTREFCEHILSFQTSLEEEAQDLITLSPRLDFSLPNLENVRITERVHEKDKEEETLKVWEPTLYQKCTYS